MALLDHNPHAILWGAGLAKRSLEAIYGGTGSINDQIGRYLYLGENLPDNRESGTGHSCEYRQN